MPSVRTNSNETLAIGRAARESGLPIWILRELDARNIVNAKRSGGGRRLYTRDCLQTLRHISDLMNDKGVNLAGIQVILELEQTLAAPQEEL